MMFPFVLAVPLAASVGIYILFRSLEGGKGYWLAAAKAAAVTASVRISLVASGVYLLENTSGWLQLPAYLMALCGLPEMYLMPKPTWGRFGTLLGLGAWMIVGSAAWIFGLAALAAGAQRKSQSSG